MEISEIQGATFDPLDNRLRYSLWRRWKLDANPRVCFIMLNPSTATATRDDPTIKACIAFAQAWGMNSLEVVNLFAYRTSLPKKLRYDMSIGIPVVGYKNDEFIKRAVEGADEVVAAWGGYKWADARAREVVKIVTATGKLLCCLGVGKNGPKHPLYIKRTTELKAYFMPPLEEK